METTSKYSQAERINTVTALSRMLGIVIELPQPTSALRLYDQRRHRDRIFGMDIFGEPAWDILLDLYHMETLDKRVQVTSACIASHVPSTTALRWIDVLIKHGLVARRLDQQDRRRNWIGLTGKGRDLMERCLRQFAAM